MIAIEYAIALIITLTAFVIGIAIGRITKKKFINQIYKNDQFIYNYYLWFAHHADKKKYTVDQIKSKLLQVATKKQIDMLEKYYFKQKRKRLKEEIKDFKQEALKKRYQDIINEKILK